MRKSLWIGLLISLLAIAGLTLIGPAEETLGTNVRVVYLHGVWVWAAMAAFTLAALVGLAGLITRRRSLNLWSRALGRTGLIFWLTYLPISLWAMQTNWNGLFLAEPRWKLAAVFALGGLIIQVGLTLMEDPHWASIANLLYWLALMFSLQTTEKVLHPGSPIFSSDSLLIKVYFSVLLLLTLIAAGLVTFLWRSRDKSEAES